MCLAIPMKIKNIKGEFAQVETGRLTRTVNIQMLPGLTVGDYVIVHAGFAIQKIDPEKAKDTLKLIHEIHR
jgi:hydrogenase expression/formation protein HypC